MNVLFPYPRLPAVELSLGDLQVSGVPHPGIEEQLTRIDVASSPPTDGASIGLAATITVEEPHDLGVEDEELTAVVVAHCRATNVRYGFVAEPLEGTGWRADIRLDRDELREDVSLYAEVALIMEGEPPRKVGTSAAWTLVVDETARPAFNGTFQVKWVAFSGEQADPSVPASSKEETFFVDLAGSVPRLLLNRSFDGLQSLLGGSGNDAAAVEELRRSEQRRMATAALSAATSASIAAIRRNEELDSYELPDVAWKADLLRWLASDAFPDRTLDETLRALKRNDPDEAATTFAVLQSAVAKRVKATVTLARAIKSLEGVAGEEGS